LHCLATANDSAKLTTVAMPDMQLSDFCISLQAAAPMHAHMLFP
jgi:hypothetical protein